MKNKLIIFLTILLIPLTLGITQQEEKVIRNLTLQNADINSVLSFLADYGDVNIVSSPTVQASVTLSLQNVTWRQALDIVIKTYHLAAIQEEGYIRVLPLDDYLKEQSSIEKHKAEQKLLVGLEMQIVSIKYSNAKDMVIPLKSMLSDRGSINVVERTNSLIIRDTPENIARVQEIVKTLDTETQQIRISAQLLEMDTDLLKEFGVNWMFSGTRQVNFGREDWDASVDSGTGQFADKVSDPVGRFLFGLLRTDGAANISGQISALASNTKLKIVAHPEITTLDNKLATIQLGEKIPIKQFDAAGNVVITFVDVGTILKVTPHITAENKILMHIKPERSQSKSDPAGIIIQTTNAETNVMVENGQTVVIGGLTTQDEEKLNTGIPILKDIPILGYLFRYTRKKISTKDLVIFVTPTIVTEEMHGSTDTTEPTQP
ncbi:MAG TPA: type IV pilus secretin PilQ [candidate division Zixibacteria bacterium]|nr:type IV pilus secretin PilQ [candidate division Zixibacteria bacterium]